MEGREWFIWQGIWEFTENSEPKLPKDNELPDSVYEAKKIICPLGLGYNVSRNSLFFYLSGAGL